MTITQNGVSFPRWLLQPRPQRLHLPIGLVRPAAPELPAQTEVVPWDRRCPSVVLARRIRRLPPHYGGYLSTIAVRLDECGVHVADRWSFWMRLVMPKRFV